MNDLLLTQESIQPKTEVHASDGSKEKREKLNFCDTKKDFVEALKDKEEQQKHSDIYTQDTHSNSSDIFEKNTIICDEISTNEYANKEISNVHICDLDDAYNDELCVVNYAIESVPLIEENEKNNQSIFSQLQVEEREKSSIQKQKNGRVFLNEVSDYQTCVQVDIQNIINVPLNEEKLVSKQWIDDAEAEVGQAGFKCIVDAKQTASVSDIIKPKQGHLLRDNISSPSSENPVPVEAQSLAKIQSTQYEIPRGVFGIKHAQNLGNIEGNFVSKKNVEIDSSSEQKQSVVVGKTLAKIFVEEQNQDNGSVKLETHIKHHNVIDFPVSHKTVQGKYEEGQCNYTDPSNEIIAAIAQQVDTMKRGRRNSVIVKVDLENGESLNCQVALSDSNVEVRFPSLELAFKEQILSHWGQLKQVAAAKNLNLVNPFFNNHLTL